MSLAITLVLRNPNFSVTGFTQIEILKLWGEFFNWAIAVINMKPSPHVPQRSRYEVFKKKTPNMQNIRLLPIGAIVMAWRKHGLKEAYYAIGLYVGPSLSTEGCARIAVKTGNLVKILTTSHFSAASDGGGLNVFPRVTCGLKQLLEEQLTSSSTEKGEILVEDPDRDMSSLVSIPLVAPTEDSPTLDSFTDAMQYPADVSALPLPILSDSIPESSVNDPSPVILLLNTPPVLNNTECPSLSVISTAPVVEPVTNVRRSARQVARRERRNKILQEASYVDTTEYSYFADWTTHQDASMYWSFSDF